MLTVSLLREANDPNKHKQTKCIITQEDRDQLFLINVLKQPEFYV